MRKLALDYYACPSCKHFPLKLSVEREEVVFDNYTDSLPNGFHCEKYCASAERLVDVSETHEDIDCKECRIVHIKSGSLFCERCFRVFSVQNFIPDLREEQSVVQKSFDANKGKTVRVEDSLVLGEKKDALIAEKVKNLLPFEKAKKKKAQKNLSHDLDYRAGHAEKDKYIQLFENRFDFDRDVVLELGIGQGGFSSSVKNKLKPDIVFGLDYEPKWLEIAKIRDFETEVVAADARKLPFRDDVFDLAYSAYTLEHIPGFEPAIMELSRTAENAFLVFGPSKFSVLDMHFERAPFVPILPKSLAVKMSYYWKVKRAGFDYTKEEIADEYDQMNYISPLYFEKVAKEYGFSVTSLFTAFLRNAFRNEYQYHGFMKLAGYVWFLFMPFAWLFEKLRVQPIMVYFLKRK